MSTIQPKGEKLRQAVKWISQRLQENEKDSVSLLVEEGCLQFNLSPKEGEFLMSFFRAGST